MEVASKFKFIIFFLNFNFMLQFFISIINGQDCGADLDCQIKQIQREIDAIAPAQENNKKELSGLNSQLADLQARITSFSKQLGKVQNDIAQREEDLAYTKKIFEEKTSNHYKFLRTYDPILPFLSTSDASTAFREIIFRHRAAEEDRKSIEQFAG